MSRQTINDTFTLSIPDSFECMRSTELQELSRNGWDPYRWGARDREKHILFVVLWKPVPAILGWLADLKGIARRNAALTARAYAEHGYQFLQSDSLDNGQIKAEGYQFAYSAGSIRQMATKFLAKDRKMVYSFIWIGREENTASDRALFRDVMESLQHV
ncbi:MAG: hypothetical protein IJ246_12050 [Clostridia bacterium]|nr:hypothetical protein [Clostridia bacterium]